MITFRRSLNPSSPLTFVFSLTVCLTLVATPLSQMRTRAEGEKQTGHANIGQAAFGRQGPEALRQSAAAAQPVSTKMDETLRAAIEASLYRVEKREGTKSGGNKGVSYRAHNPAQSLCAEFSAAKMTVAPSSGKHASWHLSLDMVSYGYGNRLEAPQTSSLNASANRVEYQHRSKGKGNVGLQEWFANRPLGIEHGFVVAAPPGSKKTGELLRFALRFSGNLRANLDGSQQSLVLTTRVGKPVLNYDHLEVFDARGRVLPSHFELDRDRLQILIDDAGASYPVTVDPMLSEIKKVTASDGMGGDGMGISGDLFGRSASISGNTAVVGAYFDDSQTGSAYIYSRNQGGANNWGEVKKITASDRATGDQFGLNVSISLDTVVVGALMDDAGKGSAYVFDRNQGGANNWGQVKKLVGSDSVAGNQFGIGVGLSGDTAVVGANAGNALTGAAYIFGRNQGGANNWGEVKKITASDAAVGAGFGQSVSIASSTIIVGSPNLASFAGAAYLFDRDQGGANNWGEVKKITAGDAAGGDSFGVSVFINVDTAVVGAFGKGAGLGAAYVFGRNQGGASNWGQIKKLLAGDGVAGDLFGISVAISADTALVGSRDDDSSKGSAYIFDRDQGGANNWGQVQKLTASDGAAGDQFGYFVALSGLTAIVGAPGDEIGKGGSYIFGSGSPTAANGIVSGRVVDDDGSPVEGAVIRLNGSQSRKTITDANGNYHFDNVETNGFYTVTPSRVNYLFNPFSRSFSQLGSSTEATFSATFTGNTVNPLDTPEFFVRQHYLDFLGREPDESGFNFWSDQIASCGSDAGCLEVKRINVSAAYFLSIEFQQTGGLVDGLYRTSYGRRPLYAEFMPDTARVAQNVIVGRGDWQQQLAANKQAFIEAFVQRAAFRDAYDNLSNSQFVDELIAHTGISFAQSECDELVNGLANNTLTRSAVLQRVATDERFESAKRNEAFVMMEYFGYLRRDPDDDGYQFWLNKLNQFGGDFQRAEMVKAFIISSEYRTRFPR